MPPGRVSRACVRRSRVVSGFKYRVARLKTHGSRLVGWQREEYVGGFRNSGYLLGVIIRRESYYLGPCYERSLLFGGSSVGVPYSR